LLCHSGKIANFSSRKKRRTLRFSHHDASLTYIHPLAASPLPQANTFFALLQLSDVRQFLLLLHSWEQQQKKMSTM
jgi:hypothetical protein